MKHVFEKRTRMILQLLAVLVFCFVATLQSARAEEKEPPIYKIAINDVTAWVVMDSPIIFPATVFAIENDPEKMRIGNFINGNQDAVTKVHLVKVKDKLILIDGGWGKIYCNDIYDTGYAYERLVKAGVNPDDITDVLITHPDHDHLPGLALNGVPRYPNATFHMSRIDNDLIVKQGITRGPASVQFARDAIAAYTRVNLFEDNHEVVPGVKAIITAGHSMGHTCYKITSGDKSLVVIGDMLHSYPLQFRFPRSSDAYDYDTVLAALNREAFYETLTPTNTIFTGTHFPEIGVVRRNPEGGYVLVPQPALVTAVDRIDYK